MMIEDHGFATRKFYGYSGQWVDVVSDATREHERRFALSMNGRNVAMIGDNRSVARALISRGYLHTAWDAVY